MESTWHFQFNMQFWFQKNRFRDIAVAKIIVSKGSSGNVSVNVVCYLTYYLLFGTSDHWCIGLILTKMIESTCCFAMQMRQTAWIDQNWYIWQRACILSYEIARLTFQKAALVTTQVETWVEHVDLAHWNHCMLALSSWVRVTPAWWDTLHSKLFFATGSCCLWLFRSFRCLHNLVSNVDRRLCMLI